MVVEASQITAGVYPLQCLRFPSENETVISRTVGSSLVVVGSTGVEVSEGVVGDVGFVSTTYIWLIIAAGEKAMSQPLNGNDYFIKLKTQLPPVRSSA
ncbi:hypothetical protein L596_004649 [Steinernema carpocapsae]|uniref:Uncharacterized protein n=1 Tax=Steinernema carpocapsae TaxID=34508 RepID=A0A4U8V018_STECR|nr:hypothetical protein L596_004649 [Steinernema carpocapsae]